MNVRCLGADVLGPTLAAELVRTYLSARFDAAPSSVRRVAKLTAMERPR